MTHTLDNRGVIGKRWLKWLLIGIQQQAGIKGLWRLHSSQCRAVQGMAAITRDLPYRIVECHNGDSSPITASRLDHTVDERNAG